MRIAFTFALLFVACSQPPPQEEPEPKTDNIDVERVLEQNRLAQEKHTRAMAEMRAIMAAERRAEAELAERLAEAEARRRARAGTSGAVGGEPPVEEGSINDPAWRSAQDAKIRAIRYRARAERIWDYLGSAGDQLSADERATMTEMAKQLDHLAEQSELAARR